MLSAINIFLAKAEAIVSCNKVATLALATGMAIGARPVDVTERDEDQVALTGEIYALMQIATGVCDVGYDDADAGERINALNVQYNEIKARVLDACRKKVHNAEEFISKTGVVG